MLPFFISPLLKRHLPNVSSLFQRNVRAHVSRSSRLTVKGCNQSGISCVGFSLYISSEKNCMLVHGFPWHACQDLSASASRMHACHVESWLDHPSISMLKTNCCWNRWQSWYNKKYEVVHCTSNWLPIIGQSWSISVFWAKKMKQWKRGRFIEYSHCYEQIEIVNKNSCVLVHLHFSLSRLDPVVGFLELLREVSISSEHKSLLLSIVQFFSPNSTLFCCHNLLIMKFHQVLFLRIGRARISLVRFTFFEVIPSDCPFLSRMKLCTRCILRISGVSRRSVQSQFFNFP